MTPFRVLIADDHPLAREAIRSLLEDDSRLEIVGEAANGLEAAKLCTTLLPDLLLIDINMPVLNGLEATRLIKKTQPQIKIVILSVSDDAADLFTALQCGAQGYLLKNLEPDDWVTYLHALLEEDVHIPRQMASRMLHHFQSQQEADGPGPEALTAREREILLLVAQGDTNRKIAEQLNIAENTVKNHVKNILEKLGLENRVQMAAYAIHHNLL